MCVLPLSCFPLHGMASKILIIQISSITCIILHISWLYQADAQIQHLEHRPLDMQCPESDSNGQRNLQGIETLTSSNPFSKRTGQSDITDDFLDEYLEMWQDNTRFRDSGIPTNRRSESPTVFNKPFFQGFRPRQPPSKTETFSPPLLKRGQRETAPRLQDTMYSYGVNESAAQDEKRSDSVSSKPEVLLETGLRLLGEMKTLLKETKLVKRSTQGGFSGAMEPYSRDLALPWTCQSQKVWVDLGPNVYPRYVSDTRCVNTTCWYGHYACNPHRIDLPVLMRHFGACVDHRLPEDIRDQYMLKTVEISGTCFCDRR